MNPGGRISQGLCDGHQLQSFRRLVLVSFVHVIPSRDYGLQLGVGGGLRFTLSQLVYVLEALLVFR